MLRLLGNRVESSLICLFSQSISKREIRLNKNSSNESLQVSSKPKQRDQAILAITNINQGNKVKKIKLPFKLKNEEQNFIYKGKSSHITNELDNQDPESLLKTEEDLDIYAKDENLYHQKVINEDMKKRRQIKFGIVKKRIDKIEGRDEKNFNLLTWDAKEQIKHLHMNDPQTWTPEKISESFPLTVESCKKLLKSKWTPKTLDELERHDEKAMQNWKLLENIEKNPNSAGPAINIYREYKKMNKLNLLKHAAGLPGIDFERKSHIFSDSYAVHESLLCEPGKFSNIVVHRDDSIKKIFNRQVDEKEFKQICKSSDDSKSNFKDHLMTTKTQLSKSLAKIFSNNEIKKSK